MQEIAFFCHVDEVIFHIFDVRDNQAFDDRLIKNIERFGSRAEMWSRKQLPAI